MTTYNTTNEHKAPTDESVRLYREFLEQARGEVVASLTYPVHIDGKTLGSVVTSHSYIDSIYHVHVNILGNKQRFHFPSYAYTELTLKKEIFDRVTKCVALVLLENMDKQYLP